MDINNVGLAREYAGWLERRRSHGELVARFERIVRARGPALSGRLRADLVEFLRERSATALARSIALNDDPRDDCDFVAWTEEAKRF